MMNKPYWIGVDGTDGYIDGVDEFFYFAFSKSSSRCEIDCPCKKCNNELATP